MAALYWRADDFRQVLRMASVAVLIFYALVTAFVPAELLQLANDDDFYAAPISRQEAEEHFQAHLQRAIDALAGIRPSATDHAPAIPFPKITSVSQESGVQSTFALATALVPLALIATGALKTTDIRVIIPSTLDSSPQYGVPRLPPRRRS